MPASAVSGLAAAAVVLAVVAVVRQRWWLTGAAAGSAVLASLVGSFDGAAAMDGVTAVVFVAAMVLVAAAAEQSGLLAALAAQLVRRVRGHVPLVLATFVAGVVVTTFLNLDTTAVLFTPLALSIAVAAGFDGVPFAFAALAAANFGSMLLPTSNLTNLVLWRHSGQAFATFAAHLAPVAAVSFVVVAVALATVAAAHRRLAPAMVTTVTAAAGVAQPSSAGGAAITDRRSAAVSAVAIVGLVVAFTAGMPVAPGAVLAAAAVVAVRPSLWRERLPLVLAVAVVALFVAAGVLRSSLDLTTSVPTWSAARLAFAGAALANVGSNLASVLLLQPLATTAAYQRALLVGVNLGAGLTPIGSLATVLWRDALRRRGAAVSWGSFAAFSCPLSAVLVVAALLLPAPR